MKKIIILFILLIITSLLYAESDTLAIPDTLTAEEVSMERGYISAIYHIYREGVMPWFEDYQDSTVLFYYDDNKQTGVLYYDMRSKQWVGFPILDKPKRKLVWQRKANKKE